MNKNQLIQLIQRIQEHRAFIPINGKKSLPPPSKVTPDTLQRIATEVLGHVPDWAKDFRDGDSLVAHIPANGQPVLKVVYHREAIAI